MVQVGARQELIWTGLGRRVDGNMFARDLGEQQEAYNQGRIYQEPLGCLLLSSQWKDRDEKGFGDGSGRAVREDGLQLKSL